MSRTLLVIALLGLVAAASAFHINKVRTATPEGWLRMARADPRHTLSFRVALRQQNVDVLEVRICSISGVEALKAPFCFDLGGLTFSLLLSFLIFRLVAHGFGARRP